MQRKIRKVLRSRGLEQTILFVLFAENNLKTTTSIYFQLNISEVVQLGQVFSQKLTR